MIHMFLVQYIVIYIKYTNVNFVFLLFLFNRASAQTALCPNGSTQASYLRYPEVELLLKNKIWLLWFCFLLFEFIETFSNARLLEI